jgi:energy-coupling factor transport system ATP-binding protein
MASIELDNVTLSHRGSEGEPLFADFSLKIPSGEWVVVVGPSGAGKTTLLKLMKGLFRPGAGKIRVNGSILAPGELNRFAACVFANPENQIVSPLVYEDVVFGLENMGFSPDTIGIRVEETLRWVGLWERAKDFSHHLSGGEQQRLILAGALALQKECLLLDDPLSMVDRSSRSRILELLQRIHQGESCTLIYATHLLEDALVAERLIALEDGRLLYDGPPRSFLHEKRLIERLGLEVPIIVELAETVGARGVARAEDVATLDQLLALLTAIEREKDN